MADNKDKWQEAKREIIDKLDIRREYEALGITPIGEPNSKGWILCRGTIGRAGNEDKSPSAGFNVGDGPHRGRYKDFGSGGKTVNLFDFAAANGKCGGDFKQILVYYARAAGVKLPDGADDTTAAKMEFFPLTYGPLMLYAQGKPGVTIEAIKRVGGMGGRWPKDLSPDKQNHLLSFPQYGSALLDLDPVGWHSCAMKPTGQVRFYKGPGVPEEFRKTVQLGEPGLMNVHALNRLMHESEKVEVIVSLEGLSDLLCAEGICPVDGPEVVVATGGCKYYLKPEWMQRFIGKELWIVRDVHDDDDAGQQAAAVDAGIAVAAGITVRNVILPTSSESEKMDFRKWIVAGHTWAEFVAHARTFEPLKAEDTSGLLTAGEALLKDLGIVVVGEHEGSQRIEIFCDHTRKVSTIYDIDKFSYSKLIQFVGPEKVDNLVYDGRDPVAGKASIKQVRNAIAAEASTKSFADNEKIGSGIWGVDGKTVLVKSGEYGVIEPGPKIVRSHMPFYRGRVIDLGAKVPNWCEFGQAGRFLQQAQSDEWCRSVFEDAERIFAKWYWKYAPSPRVVASLVCSTWVQTLWNWRPEVVVTGGSDTGKSMLLKDTLAEGLFGPLAMYVIKPTEAAIRQHVKHHGTILLLDEFEHDQNREAVMKLLRTASRGGSVYRGTSDQKGAKYSLSVLVWMAAIEMGLRDTADVNRVIILDLENIPKEARGKQVMPNQFQLRELGQKLMAIGIRHQRTAAAISETLRGQTYDGIPGRIVESFSIPNAMISAIYGHGTNQTVDAAAELLGGWNFVNQQAKDESRLIQEILTAEVFLDGGRRMTVNQILKASPEPDLSSALHRSGLHRLVKRSKKDFVGHRGRDYLFIAHEVCRKQLLSRSPFATQTIEQYLLRVEGAIWDRQRLGGLHVVGGVSIPYEAIEKMFDKPIDDNSEFLPDEEGVNNEPFEEFT